MEKVYPYPPDINWVRNYSKQPDAEFIPIERYKVLIGTFNPNTGKEEFEVINPLRVLSIGGLYLVECDDDSDNWAMGDMVDGYIKCWAFYGGLKIAIDGL